ncbi:MULTISPECIES: TetR/AcrR family transcriptional regulator [unclassified Azospirillum]|uniref:TetR/AcrR family transcriptional regulator n=1 Tax=unclassified Azospirillum TaxID=2630922 RepID=UPI000B6360A0|nr:MULTISPECIES: TetR/AcrR family transcriptional regulator [unclassified Azospirillum]SNS51991.1 transcriptional regulator, TetR family [Azospirillum sp. RU38E]SNS69515.1 transcriptional regulator, TetR family [Azospirillum sp. RU37A]
MARPSLTEEQVNEVRQRLLLETGRLIAREGYAGFSMRRLGAAVEMTAGALYRYFPTRQHVLLAYFAAALTSLSQRLDAIDAAEPDPLRAVHRLALAYADFCLEDRDRFRLLFLENDQGQFQELSSDPILLHPYQLLRTRVQQAIIAGLLRPLPADMATQLVWAAVHGVISLSINVPEIDFGEVRPLADAAATMAIRGLANPSALPSLER